MLSLSGNPTGFREAMMLPILHKASHLFREDAYSEYCWSVDVYGAYQPTSFIYLSFEAFRDAAAHESLLLTVPALTDSGGKRTSFPTRMEREWTSHPFDRFYGLVCRLEDRGDAELVEQFLQRDDNVIALLPNEMIGLYYGGYQGGTEKPLAEAAACIDLLGLHQYKERLNARVISTGDVWWDQVPRPKGKLFVTNDAFLSDGFFMDGYGKTEDNSQKIIDLIRNFAVRRDSRLLVVAESTGNHWPCHEPYTLTLRVKNLGPAFTDATLAVNLDASCEPTTATEVGLPAMESLAEVTVAFQFIPRVGKFITQVCTATAQHSGEPIEVFLAANGLNVTASLRSLIGTQGISDDAEYSRLTRIVAKTPLLIELRNFAQLARIDVEACLNKLRKAAEMLASRALGTLNPTPTVRDLNGIIKALQDNRVLSSKSIGYLHTIRVIGNLASHPSGETLTTGDVQLAAFALASVIEEMLDRGVI